MITRMLVIMTYRDCLMQSDTKREKKKEKFTDSFA